MRLSREEQRALDESDYGTRPITMPTISFEEFLRTAPHSGECECDACHWWTDHSEVVNFAEWMVEGGLSTPDLFDLLRKPWKWKAEHTEYAAQVSK